MSQIDSHQDRLRLKSLYAQKNDEELLILRADFGSLTEVAQNALKAELHERKLWADEVDVQSANPAKPTGCESFTHKGIRGFGFCY